MQLLNSHNQILQPASPDVDTTVEPALRALVELCRKITKAECYKQALGSAEEKEQTAWLIALQIYQEWGLTHVEQALAAGSADPCYRELKRQINQALIGQCHANGFRRFYHKENRHKSRWLPEASSFSDSGVSHETEVEQERDIYNQFLASHVLHTTSVELPLAAIMPTTAQVHIQSQAVKLSQRRWPTGVTSPGPVAEPSVAQPVGGPAPTTTLTKKEYQIMFALLDREIPRALVAEWLGLSQGNLNWHLSQLYQKLRVHSLEEARQRFAHLYDLVALLVG